MRRNKREETLRKPPSARSRSAISRDLSTIQEGTACSLCLLPCNALTRFCNSPELPKRQWVTCDTGPSTSGAYIQRDNKINPRLFLAACLSFQARLLRYVRDDTVERVRGAVNNPRVLFVSTLINVLKWKTVYCAVLFT